MKWSFFFSLLISLTVTEHRKPEVTRRLGEMILKWQAGTRTYIHFDTEIATAIVWIKSNSILARTHSTVWSNVKANIASYWTAAGGAIASCMSVCVARPNSAQWMHFTMRCRDKTPANSDARLHNNVCAHVRLCLFVAHSSTQSEFSTWIGRFRLEIVDACGFRLFASPFSALFSLSNRACSQALLHSRICIQWAHSLSLHLICTAVDLHPTYSSPSVYEFFSRIVFVV